MASAYSRPHNYDQELYQPNLELINTVLQFKQGSYNANKAKLQTMYDKFTFLEVAKAQDQEHLENRLQEVKSIMDKYTVMDLSSNNLTSQLMSNMGQVVDDKVTNAVVSTRLYNQEQQAWAKLREEHPDKYSEVNQAYASQAPQAWLNDGQVGSKYRGGGGIIEYQDVQGKLAKEIPNIAKNLKAEWVELSDGSGYFRDVVTKERVDRGRLESAMDGLLTPKDQQQLQINAWGQYDNMSDEQLEAEYTRHFAPKIDKIQDTVNSLRSTIDSTSDPKLKKQLQDTLGVYEGQLAAYEANNYRNISNNYGREGAYQTLYDNQFRGNYLDAYSYMDRTTKIATYDNDVKTRNYELNVAKFNETMRANAARENIALAKLQKSNTKGSGKGSVQGEPGYVAPLVGTEAVLTYEEEGSKISQHNENNAKILKDTQELFGIDNLGETRELLSVFSKGWAGKEFIEFKGKKINVQDNLELLLDYQNNIINKSPVEKEALKQFNQAIGKSLNTLRRVAQGDSPDWDSTESTPHYNFKFVEDPETGTMKKVVIDDPKNNNHYSDLLKKPNLTPEEEYTLSVYHKIHLLIDPEVSAEHKAFLLEDLQTNEFNQLSNEDFNSFPTAVTDYNIASIRGGKGGTYSATANNAALAKKDGFYDRHPNILSGAEHTDSYNHITVSGGKHMTDIVNKIDVLYGELGAAKGNPKKEAVVRDKIHKLEAQMDRVDNLLTPVIIVKPLQGRSDFYLSDITAADAEYYDTDGTEVSLKSPSEILEEGSKVFNNTLEQEYKDQDLNPSLYPQIFNNETSGYKNLTTLIGLPAGAKEVITVERVWDEENKQPTDEVKWSYTKTVDGEKVVFSSEDDNSVGRLKVDQLRTNNVIDFVNDPNKAAYDASWGENAHVLDLGNNQYDENLHKKTVSKYGPNLALSVDNTIPLMEDARKFGGKELADRVKAERQAFIDGEYKFQMKAVDGYWKYVITKDGNEVYSDYTDPSGVTKYSTQEVVNIHNESEAVVNQVMYNYLESIIEKYHTDYILDYQAEQEKDL